MVELFEYEELVEATEGFCSCRLIGKGSHGLVYKGKLKSNNVVAIKKAQQYGEDKLVFQDNSKMDNEIRVLSSLSENPNVISFLGTSNQHLKRNNNLLVMEFMPNGSLHDLLHHSDKNPPMTWSKRVEIAIQIARAVEFLHENQPLVIHRDIKSANVLFDSNWDAKLADFGLAVLVVNDSTSQVSLPAGTIGYIDPCYTLPTKLSTKSDVYSFGTLLLEIISGGKAIDVNREPACIAEWAEPLIKERKLNEICDRRIALPDCMVSTIKKILGLAANCVSLNEARRPSMAEVVNKMEGCFIERVKLPNWISLLQSTVMLLRKRRKFPKRDRQKSCVASNLKGNAS